MEDIEKRIIRRKKGAFLEHLSITDDFLDELRLKNIIAADVIDSIEVEKMNGARMNKLLEHILSLPNSFETLSSILYKDHAWLSRDIEAEILAENGSLQVEESLVRETSMLVHRKFGSSKRLCETDKREIQEMMALKLQIAKGEFTQEVDKIKDDLNKQIKFNKANEKLAACMTKTIKRFIKDHDAQLTSHAHGTKTTKDVLQLTMTEMSMTSLEKFEKYFQYIMLKFDHALKQRDILLEERGKALRVLGVGEESDLPLDALLKQVKEKETRPIMVEMPNNHILEQKRPKTANHVMNGTDHVYVVKRLNAKISDMESTLEEKEEEIKRLEDELKKLKTGDTLPEIKQNGTTEENLNNEMNGTLQYIDEPVSIKTKSRRKSARKSIKK